MSLIIQWGSTACVTGLPCAALPFWQPAICQDKGEQDTSSSTPHCLVFNSHSRSHADFHWSTCPFYPEIISFFTFIEILQYTAYDFIVSSLQKLEHNSWKKIPSIGVFNHGVELYLTSHWLWKPKYVVYAIFILVRLFMNHTVHHESREEKRNKCLITTSESHLCSRLQSRPAPPQIISSVGLTLTLTRLYTS